MSDICCVSQGLWLHLQPNPRHAQLSPWFSDQSSKLYLHQVMKLSNEDHADLDMLPDYGNSGEWTIPGRCDTWHESWLYIQPHRRHVMLPAPCCFDQASELHLNQMMKLTNEDHSGLDMLPYNGRSVGGWMDRVWHVWNMPRVIAPSSTPTTLLTSCSAISLAF